MKIRNGFVSNSSSSSFIIIKDGNKDILSVECAVTFPIQDSKTEFGWEFEKTYDIGGKINFCYLQTSYAKNKVWLQMLEEVIKENTNINVIKWDLSTDDNHSNYGYIDHQSAYPDNVEMFKNKDMLKTFLFSCSSYIEGGNDNV